MTSTHTRWTAFAVRKQFLDYFIQNRDHRFVPSSSVVPHNDPTLLFANAGMNQFKPMFLGSVDPLSDFATLKRAVNSQKCIRAGGKHNDLEDVGKDSYHHTFFEMLGNWSFGDYFKKEAIEWSWELLTKVFGLAPDRLYATYFEGNPEAGLEPDLEAKELWKSVGLPDDHVLPGSMKDNFWEMGDQGPCGPCSEIHYDRIGGRNAAHLVNMDDPNVLEIWNNVFIQYNREPDRSLRSLPSKHVDTGMGFERLVSVLQDVPSNYDTDVFSPLFKRIQEITGAREYRGKFYEEDTDGVDTAYRVIADHVRTMTFAIGDGAVPHSVGRGYVVRRILRRGCRYARKYFGVQIGDFFSKIVPTLVDQMGDMFPEIRKRQQDIIEILNEEELSFAKTLDRGEGMFEKYAQQCLTKGLTHLPGEDVWRLYDTYGFPTDLTRIMAEERGLKINEEDVGEAQERAREASKGEKKAGAATFKVDVHDLNYLQQEIRLPKTDDTAKFGRDNITARIKAIFSNKKFVKSTKEAASDEQIGLILDRTNFYAEQGGQEYDTGRIVVDGKAETVIESVQLYGGYVLHIGSMVYGDFSVEDEILCDYDELRRNSIRNNHTGTHVLNHSLREVLGDGIDQAGSLVAPEKLRFDFTHNSAVSDAELDRIEKSSTAYIRQNCEVYAKEVPLAIAKEIEGVRRVFGETYPDPVRVVSVGVPVEDLLADPKCKEWRKISVEFCGGTHVDKTGEIKELIILSENGISKGIRRIEAVTGQMAYDVQRTAEQFRQRLDQLDHMTGSPAEKEAALKPVQVDLGTLSISAVTKAQFRDRVAKAVKGVMNDIKTAQKLETQSALDAVKLSFERVGGKKAVVHKLEIGQKALTEAIKTISTKQKDSTVYLFGAESGRVVHGCHVSESFSKQGASAPEWANTVAGAVGGKAGGKGATSIGNGTNPERIDEGIRLATEYIEKFSL